MLDTSPEEHSARSGARSAGLPAAAFRAAAKHVKRARECQAGQAPEQHLWELQLIQQRRGAELGVTEPIPLYETPGWLNMRNDCLSTSSVPSAPDHDPDSPFSAIRRLRSGRAGARRWK